MVSNTSAWNGWRALDVTKSGFYWHFRDRSQLLREMLDTKRRAAEIVYSPGIPHFQEAAGDRSRRRTVVVELVDAADFLAANGVR